MAGKLRFTKVNGLGNDYCVFDAEGCAGWTDERWGDLARAISDRETGVGSDGILVLGEGETLDDSITVASMRVYNADGSRGEMCGNGLRCVGRLLVERGVARAGGSQGFVISTDAGLRTVWVDPGNMETVRTTLGRAMFGPEAVGANIDLLGRSHADPDLWSAEGEWFRLVSVGNPHAIVELYKPISPDEVARRGALIENSKAFPNQINVHFVFVLDRFIGGVSSWERGSGATMACGTGIAASAAGFVAAGMIDREIQISQPGGVMTIEIGMDGEIYQTGPTEIEFEGEWKSA